MKHSIGDTVKCIKDLVMNDCGTIEFTTGKIYEIIGISQEDGYKLIDNSKVDHYMNTGDYFEQYFEPESGSGLTPEERFDYAMRSI